MIDSSANAQSTPDDDRSSAPADRRGEIDRLMLRPLGRPAHRRRRRAVLPLATFAAMGLIAGPLGALPAAAAEPVAIADVQGAADASPLAGQTVTVQGVVTGYYAQPSNYRGLYIQTQGSGGAADATPGASDGVFVYVNATYPDVTVGDLVTATGSVSEFQGQTQITASAAGSVALVTAGVDLPEAAPLADTVVGPAREAYEGMLVQPSGTYALASTHQIFNFGTLWLSAGGPVVKSTETTDAGPDADAIAAANRAKRLLVDDGYAVQVTNAAHPGEQPYLTKDAVIRLGDTLVPPQNPMILGYGFDDWRLQPQIPLNDASDAAYKPGFSSVNPRPEASPEVGGDVVFASYNVENYFTTFGGDARGADTPEQFAVQKSKTIAAITGLGADVVAIAEMENSVKLGKPVDSALQDLVAGLNKAEGAGTWDYVRTPAALQDPATTDFITNAIIFKPASVTPVGDSFAQVDEAVWSNAREPLAQTFDIGDGRLVTAVANHLKSKSPPTGGGAEPADGQGFFNADRTAQAESIVDLVTGISADPAKGPDIMLLGDFNAYGQEDPIQVFLNAGWTDLRPAATDPAAPGTYSYSFNGELGSLDHAIASPSLADSVAGVGIWGINSAEWGDRGYAFAATEPGTPWRSSDHDPIKVGLTADAGPVTVDVLTINDFHGRLEAGTGTSAVGGAAVLGGLVKQVEAENPNTLFVSSGDMVGASTFTSFIQQDKPTVDALNAMGLDVSALGNHEFDQGRADVDDRLADLADFPWLSANLIDRATGEPAYAEYALEEVGGVTVGFIGAVTEDLPNLVSPTGIASLEVAPVVPAVTDVAARLQDGDDANGEADALVLLVHEGAPDATIESATGNNAFGAIVNGVVGKVDAVVSAHTHQQYAHPVPVPGSDVPMPVVQAGQYSEAYGRLTMTLDPASGDLTAITGAVAPLKGAAEPDPAIAQIVADAVAVAAVEGSRSLGSVTTDVTRGAQADGSDNRGSESTLSNLIADAQLAATQDLNAQVALMNPGGVRADVTYAGTGPADPDGNVTYAEAAAVQPFANTLFTIDLTGAQLKAVLEQQWQPAGSPRIFLKLGVSDGFTYSYDPTAAQGSHIRAMFLNGERVADDQVVKIVTNSFLAGGGDAFTTLTEGANRADSGRIDLQAFVDYFAANSPVAPDLGNRSTGVTLSAPADPAGYAPSESVMLTLSSMLFSKGAPITGEASISLNDPVLGETVLGTAPLTFAITDNFDEQGQATVAITIPEGVSGEQTLTVTGPEGAAVGVPITVTEAVEPPEPVVTEVYGSANKLFAWGGRGVSYTAYVVAEDGSAPVGTVTIYDGRTEIATAELTAESNGRITIDVPKLKRGVHLLRAGFDGEGFVSSRGYPSLVIAI